MTKVRKSTTKAKKFFIKGKEKVTDLDAPVVSDEFIDKQPEGEYTGQTIEVHSDTKLEDDKGTGDAYILRTYEFGTNPEFLMKMPDAQTIFDSHMRGISGMLWSDGMTPVTDLEPKIIFSKDRRKYLIMVWAKPSIGQTILETTKTLSEYARESHSRNDSNKV